MLLVVDELERIAGEADALAVISAFLRYAPPSMRIVLISRQELPLELGSGAAFGRAVALREDDLAFTAPEAAAALAKAGRDGIDAEAAVEVTGGWVAGVLFEAWRSADHVIGIGGERTASRLPRLAGARPARRRAAGLPHWRRQLLSEVTAVRAEALSQTGAAAHAPRRSARTPSASRLGRKGRTLRYLHPRFREYLLARLERRPVDEGGGAA